MNVAAVYAGLKTAVDLAAIDQLTAYDFVPEAIVAPAFFPADCTGKYDQTFGGMVDMLVTCRLLVSRADDKSGHGLLQRYLSPAGDESVKLALEGTPGVAQTLGGACDDLHVQAWQGYRYYEHNGTRYLGAELTVRIIGDPEE